MPKYQNLPIFAEKRFIEVDSVVYSEGNIRSRQRGRTGGKTIGLHFFYIKKVTLEHNVTLKRTNISSFICKLMPQLNVLSHNILYINGNST